MQSLKSKIILGLIVHRHLFRFQLQNKPFDPSIEGIHALRDRTEKGGKMFGKLPKDAMIVPLSINEQYAEWIKLPTNNSQKAMLYFHGGMYLIGSAESHRQHVIKFVSGSSINALVFNYRLAPEHPFPAALDDALAAYDLLLNEGFHPSNIVFAGDSAGGGLCLATLLAIKAKGIALPSCAAVLSPWTDLARTGKSYQTNERKCVSPIGCAENASILYAANNDLRNPFVSPLYGDLKGLPPLHISAGGNEILLDDSIQFAQKARAAGVDVTLRVDKGMCHCYPAFSNLFKEAKLAMDEICLHLKKHVGL
ncbi:MAG: alpha/beta hydrolase [Bacteroidetes bacterium]|nr:alpha/beta hydrolase [Bacteroidota bacterium]